MVNLQITLSEFDHDRDLVQIPIMEFSTENPDYWILLPFFEKVEELTGKLVDLGESVTFDIYDMPDLRKAIQEAIESIPESNEETLMEDDEEKLKTLLNRLSGMVEVAIKHDASILH